MNFLDRLKNEILVGDGAVGTMLYAKGVGLEANFDHLNLARPELVLKLHEEYIAAGAQVIETNTFGANSFRLGRHGLLDKVREINFAGAQLAREAAKAAEKAKFDAMSDEEKAAYAKKQREERTAKRAAKKAEERAALIAQLKKEIAEGKA